MPAAEQKRLTSKGLATRQRILEAARAILVDEGFERLILREVADRCGMTLGNLQYYFATRDDLLATLIQQEADADIATIEAAITEIQSALARDPGNRDLNRLLVAAHRREVDFLEKVTQRAAP